MRLSLLGLGTAALLGTATHASAQTAHDAAFAFAAGSAKAPAYLTFDVVTGGEFRFFTNTPTGVDPELRLFEGTRGTLGTVVDRDDDGCYNAPSTLCPGSSNIRDALFTSALVGGQTYTLAIGTYSFSELEARIGMMDTGDLAGRIFVDSQAGVATNYTFAYGLASSTVPEPGTWALVGTGLAGLLAAGRRRRA